MGSDIVYFGDSVYLIGICKINFMDIFYKISEHTLFLDLKHY